MLEYPRILMLQFICMTYEVRFSVVWIVILWLSGLPGLCRVSEEGGSRPFYTSGTHLPHHYLTSQLSSQLPFPLPNVITQYPPATPTMYCHNLVPNQHSLCTITTQFPTTPLTTYCHNSVPNHHTHYLPSQFGSQPPHPLPTITTQATTVC